jgi:hypothetical protein
MTDCRTAVIIRGPPRAPRANQGEPSLRKTIVGVIEESGRFRGCDGIALALNQTEQIRFAGARREIVHFVIEQNAGAFCRHSRAV